MERLTLLAHVVGVLSLFSLCRFDHDTVTTECKANTTCSGGRLIDLVPVSLLDLEVSLALRWISVILPVIYLCYVLYKIYDAFFGKVLYVFHQTERDVGYSSPGRSKRDIANIIRRKRKVGDIPPPYPNGWYEVIRSDALPRGESRAVSMLGQHFAVFRGESGSVSVMDAYCPHLGANLGVGGIIEGDCIRCPFHGWKFNGDTGECVDIAYSTAKVPKNAHVKVWTSVEVNGSVLVWYDAEGREPYFDVYQLPDIKSGKWVFKGSSIHFVNCHAEDISENGADVAHLKAVHEVGIQAGSAVDYNTSKWLGRIVTHHWKVNWEPLPPPNGHIGRMTLSMSSRLFGRWSIMDLNVEVDQIGLGVVILKFKSIFGSGAFIQTIVPEEPLYQRLTHYIYTDWWIPTFFAAWFMLRGDATQIERDAIIWGSKRYVGKPILVKEDHLILAHRRWFAQFYSENSVKFSLQKDDQHSW